MEYEVGSWYKSEFDNYFKYLKTENNLICFSEKIVNKVWDSRFVDRFRLGRMTLGFTKLNNLDEIQDYLPDDYIDKLHIIKSIIKLDYNILIKLINK